VGTTSSCPDSTHCAEFTDPSPSPAGSGLTYPHPVDDTARPFRLDPQVVLRPERFGAMAYHYGSRRLTFLRSPLLADVVRRLHEHPSLDAAVRAMVPEPQRAALHRALLTLARTHFIEPAAPPPVHQPERGGV